MKHKYSFFIAAKMAHAIDTGFAPTGVNEKLFPFQKLIVEWALKKGRCAIFADTGLGKTAMQLEWAAHVNRHTNLPVLIIAPLCVAYQTVGEGEKFNIAVNYCRTGEAVTAGVNITNYEMLEHFDMSAFGGVVLDESSILKSIGGKTKNLLITLCADVPFKLSCTATPSPNDYMELGNQSEFLGIMPSTEMLAMFFTHDGGDTAKWRLKGHGIKKFWEWMANWSICIRKPSDLGFNNVGYDLPPIKLEKHTVASAPQEGRLIPEMEDGIRGRIKSRRSGLADRVKKVADIVNASDEIFIIWCELNDESDSLEKAIPGAKAVKGADSIEKKELVLNAFSDGKLRVLITKPSIAGWGLNWQHCHNVMFCGISDSWESYYQAIRRCYRFGQMKNVNVHVVYADIENAVMRNILKKEHQNELMGNEMMEHMKKISGSIIKKTHNERAEYKRKTEHGENWKAELGDCVDVLSGMNDNSIHYSIFSPPFESLYVYSNSDYDMGNNADSEGFYKQFAFMVDALFRVLKSGRLVSFHCMNLPSSKQRDGFIGIKDFRGCLIKIFQKAGFIFHSEVVIWKDPVLAMQRTKALGLLHKQLKKDSSMSRQGIPDYLVTMRKPGDNIEPVHHTGTTFPVGVWQKYASPVWMDINPSDTLQFREARGNDDERHICPLQLGVIQRGIELWSNPGDVVLSPFMGIGSEGYVALQMERKFIGIELKESYFNIAIKNITNCTLQRTLFKSQLEMGE